MFIIYYMARSKHRTLTRLEKKHEINVPVRRVHLDTRGGWTVCVSKSSGAKQPLQMAAVDSLTNG